MERTFWIVLAGLIAVPVVAMLALIAGSLAYVQ